jgi:hypothetical protein
MCTLPGGRVVRGGRLCAGAALHLLGRLRVDDARQHPLRGHDGHVRAVHAAQRLRRRQCAARRQLEPRADSLICCVGISVDVALGEQRNDIAHGFSHGFAHSIALGFALGFAPDERVTRATIDLTFFRGFSESSF